MPQHGSNYSARRRPGSADGVNRSKFNFFQIMVMLHINLKGITKFSSMVAIILRADPSTSPDPGYGSPDPGYGVKRSKFSFYRTLSCCISN